MKFLNRMFVVAILLFSHACGSSNNSNVNVELQNTKRGFVINYANIVLASYEDSVTTAETLKTAVDTFVANPSEDGFTAMKNAWKDAREVYGQTEVYRFYEGPIESTGLEGQINAWPLDEIYIDTIIDGANEITTATLITANEMGGDANISTGYHAVEYLLWGQDLNANPSDAGLRPFTDYLDGGTAQNQGRRRTYLQLVTNLLVDDLKTVKAQWELDGIYRTELLSIDPNVAVTKILTGIRVLGGFEMSSERILLAVSAGDQEEEHSCFSDNTHVDVRANLQGILNVFRGTYLRSDGVTRVSGVSLKDVFEIADAQLAMDIETEMDAFETTAQQIYDRAAVEGVAFDQQILNVNNDDQERLRSFANSLIRYFTNDFFDASQLIGISLNPALD